MTPQDLVSREVHYCVSSLVSTLAAGAYLDVEIGRDHGVATELRDLFAAAAELAAPVDDWEEAAIQAGWSKIGSVWIHTEHENAETSPENACYASGGDDANPYQREVYEHWIVSDWLADKLEAHGEKIERDLADLTVWARTTMGQMIAADSVIEAIAAEVSL